LQQVIGFKARGKVVNKFSIAIVAQKSMLFYNKVILEVND
jgi:hypothetical protein